MRDIHPTLRRQALCHKSRSGSCDPGLIQSQRSSPEIAQVSLNPGFYIRVSFWAIRKTHIASEIALSAH